MSTEAAYVVTRIAGNADTATVGMGGQDRAAPHPAGFRPRHLRQVSRGIFSAWYRVLWHAAGLISSRDSCGPV